MTQLDFETYPLPGTQRNKARLLVLSLESISEHAKTTIMTIAREINREIQESTPNIKDRINLICLYIARIIVSGQEIPEEIFEGNYHNPDQLAWILRRLNDELRESPASLELLRRDDDSTVALMELLITEDSLKEEKEDTKARKKKKYFEDDDAVIG